MQLNDNQIPFFDAIAKNDTVIDSGTWRSGKSFELCLFMILRMIEYDRIREFLGRRTLKSVMETTFITFKEILTDHFNLKQDYDFKVKLSPPEIRFPNNSICVFGDVDANSIGKWLSSEFSDIGIDEGQELQEIAFEKMKSRQTQTIIEKQSHGKQKNKFLIAMNPPEIAEHHWSHKKFRYPETKIKKCKVVYSHIENNKENIPFDYISDMYGSVDTRTAMIYLKGLWVPILSNVVYSDFEAPTDEKTGQYIKGGNIGIFPYRGDLNNYISMDFGWTHPMSIGCWQYDKNTKSLYRIYEVVEPYVTPEKYCQLLMGEKVNISGKDYKLPMNIDNSVIVCGIESQQSRQEAAGRSNLVLMNEYFREKKRFPRIRIVSPFIYLSIAAVRSKIKTADGKIKLFVDYKNCSRFIKDTMSYHYPTDDKGNVVSEEPKKDGIVDHTQDETRYLVWYLEPINVIEKAIQY